MGDSLLCQLKNLSNQIDNGDCCPKPCAPCGPCCGPCLPPGPYLTSFINKPYVQCTMLVAPPCPIPTAPCPVKPLQMPCCEGPKPMSEEEAFKTRYANFYNYYNSEGKNDCSGSSGGGPIPPCTPERKKGVTPDGKSPCCEDLMAKKKPDCSVGGCPTGFKPCTMKMTPPYDCDPAGIWKATVLPCPAKPRKKPCPTSCG